MKLFNRGYQSAHSGELAKSADVSSGKLRAIKLVSLRKVLRCITAVIVNEVEINDSVSQKPVSRQREAALVPPPATAFPFGGVMNF